MRGFRFELLCLHDPTALRLGRKERIENLVLTHALRKLFLSIIEISDCATTDAFLVRGIHNAPRNRYQFPESKHRQHRLCDGAEIAEP